MIKFHISKKFTAEKCEARVKPCPLGGDKLHFQDKSQAETYIDDMSEFASQYIDLYKGNLEENFDKLARAYQIINKDRDTVLVNTKDNYELQTQYMPAGSIELDTRNTEEIAYKIGDDSFTEKDLEAELRRRLQKKRKKKDPLHPLLLGAKSPDRKSAKDMLEYLHIENTLKRWQGTLKGLRTYNLNVEWKKVKPTGKWKNKKEFSDWYKENNPTLQIARKRHQEYIDEVGKVIRQRMQAVELVEKLDEYVVDKSFSVSGSMSASSYIVVDKRDLQYVRDILDEDRFSYHIDQEKVNDDNEDILIRIADHDNGRSHAGIDCEFKNIRNNYSLDDVSMLIKELKNTPK